MAGYSQKKLTEKLGIKSGQVLILLNAPEDYGHQLFPIPEGCSIYDSFTEPADCIQFFTKSKSQLQENFPNLKKHLKKDGSLWICWPKKSVKRNIIAIRQPTEQKSQIEPVLDENIIREIGLENGLVDIKVIAVDEIWSGLKFVYRTKDRH